MLVLLLYSITYDVTLVWDMISTVLVHFTVTDVDWIFSTVGCARVGIKGRDSVECKKPVNMSKNRRTLCTYDIL